MSKNGKILLATGVGAAILAAGVVVGVKFAKDFIDEEKIKKLGKKISGSSARYAESKSSSAKFIGDVKAAHIALGEAGLSEDEVEELSVKLALEDGIWCYEVSYTENSAEHSYIIKADDGSVLDWSAEFED